MTSDIYIYLFIYLCAVFDRGCCSLCRVRIFGVVHIRRFAQDVWPWTSAVFPFIV